MAGLTAGCSAVAGSFEECFEQSVGVETHRKDKGSRGEVYGWETSHIKPSFNDVTNCY